VDGNGKITLPRIGEVEVKDLTPSDIVVSVRNTCRDQELIHEADVSVVLVEPAERATVKSGPLGVGDVLLVRLWDVDAPETETSLALRVPDTGSSSFLELDRLQLLD
jgi:protein involved in polysaccharide export with SLBB domain